VQKVSVHTIRTPTHGRYLVRQAATSNIAPMLVGFHGYMETAAVQMERMAAIPGVAPWLLISIQGLNRFYRGRSEDVVANWMTRQDRELAIADNAQYVSAIVDSVAGKSGASGPLVFAGFSQGVAMAFRSACQSTRRVEGLVVLGGDVPPELELAALRRVPHVLLGRGARDEWYSAAKRSEDLARLNDAGVSVDAPILDAGHEWSDEFNRLAGVFLDQRLA
jgi:predicted esterase